MDIHDIIILRGSVNMGFFSTLLLIFIILIVIILIGTLTIYHKVKNFTKDLGFNNISSLTEMIKESDEEAKYRHKTISGMTDILIPSILKDFPNFNASAIYNKVETSLLAIFSSLSKKEVSDINEIIAIRYNLEEQIKDMQASSIDVNISEVIFHDHALKTYKKDGDVLELEVNTSLEYYYSISKKGKIVEDNDYKKQTTYTTKFIYIYNEEDYIEGKNNFTLHCPNCGAPLKNIKKHFCPYCNSGVEDINLRNWYIVDYKENYK